MSLVNDALKRARRAQPKTPPPIPHQQFKPAESKPHRASLLAGMLVPGVMLVAALLVLFMAWELYRANHEEMRVTRAREIEPQSSVPLTPTMLPSEQPAVSAAPVENPVSAPQALVADSAEGKPAEVVEPAAAAPAPAPEPMKLQSLIYSPTRSTVMINGKSLFKGDKIGEWQVTAIHQESVVLSGSNSTKTLMLGN